MDKPIDIGNGLVKLSNGRIYKREIKSMKKFEKGVDKE